jgi:MYXO-CTERM domain-containing protein
MQFRQQVLALLSAGLCASAGASDTCSKVDPNNWELCIDGAYIRPPGGAGDYSFDMLAGTVTLPANGGLVATVVMHEDPDLFQEDFVMGLTSFTLHRPSDGLTLTERGRGGYLFDYPVPAGLYEVRMTGWATPFATQSIKLTYYVAFNVSPVPEPQTYAMSLAGLVALGGLAAWRRRRETHGERGPATA